LSFASYHRVLFHHVILTSLCSEVNIYLFPYPKEALHILKKGKKKASAKKEPHKKKSEVRLSNFTKAENLSVFTRAENWSDLACPFVPLRLVRFYSVFTRAKNWSDLACPFVPLGFVRFYQG
jgi:hypothetical protein